MPKPKKQTDWHKPTVVIKRAYPAWKFWKWGVLKITFYMDSMLVTEFNCREPATLSMWLKVNEDKNRAELEEFAVWRRTLTKKEIESL